MENDVDLPSEGKSHRKAQWFKNNLNIFSAASFIKQIYIFLSTQITPGRLIY